MIILEGVRQSGKTYAVNVLDKNFAHMLIYKDIGMRLIANSKVDPDDYAIGRDLAYAQSLPQMADDFLFQNNLIFDRGYWSSYVYGQAWRNKYDKDFWKEHISLVEKVWGDALNKVHIVFITLTPEDFTRIENMNRDKDVWDATKDFRNQYALYGEILNMTKVSKANIHLLPAFQKDEFIIDFFKQILR
jgi:thymidylate kinase